MGCGQNRLIHDIYYIYIYIDVYFVDTLAVAYTFSAGLGHTRFCKVKDKFIACHKIFAFFLSLSRVKCKKQQCQIPRIISHETLMKTQITNWKSDKRVKEKIKGDKRQPQIFRTTFVQSVFVLKTFPFQKKNIFIQCVEIFVERFQNFINPNIPIIRELE